MISTCRRGSNSTCRTGAYKLRTRASMCSFMYLCNVNTKSNQKKRQDGPSTMRLGGIVARFPVSLFSSLGEWARNS